MTHHSLTKVVEWLTEDLWISSSILGTSTNKMIRYNCINLIIHRPRNHFKWWNCINLIIHRNHFKWWFSCHLSLQYVYSFEKENIENWWMSSVLNVKSLYSYYLEILHQSTEYTIHSDWSIVDSTQGPLWYGSWIYNYLCNQYLSPLKLWVRIPLRWDVLDKTLCNKVCQWLAAGLWFSPGAPVGIATI